MSSNPLNPSFRKVHTVPSDAAHPTVVQAVRDHDKSITDLNQAVISLKAEVTAASAAASKTSSSTSTSSSTGLTAAQVSALATQVASLIPSSGSVTGGAVNNQAGVTTYATQQSDNAGFVVLNNAAPIATSLSSNITIPYYTWIVNYGAGTATLTPSQGTITYPGNISAANLPLASGVAAYLEYDGTNWWAIPITVSGGGASGVTKIIAGTNVTISPAGGTGAVTINATGGSGGVSSLDGITGAVHLIAGSGVTITDNAPAAGDITIAATGASGYIKGSGSIAVTGSPDNQFFTGNATVTGAAVGMAVLVSPGGTGFATTLPILTGVVGATNTVGLTAYYTQGIQAATGGFSVGSAIPVLITVFP